MAVNTSVIDIRDEQVRLLVFHKSYGLLVGKNSESRSKNNPELNNRYELFGGRVKKLEDSLDLPWPNKESIVEAGLREFVEESGIPKSYVVDRALIASFPYTVSLKKEDLDWTIYAVRFILEDSLGKKPIDRYFDERLKKENKKIVGMSFIRNYGGVNKLNLTDLTIKTIEHIKMYHKHAMPEFWG